MRKPTYRSDEDEVQHILVRDERFVRMGDDRWGLAEQVEDQTKSPAGIDRWVKSQFALRARALMLELQDLHQRQQEPYLTVPDHLLPPESFRDVGTMEPPFDLDHTFDLKTAAEIHKTDAVASAYIRWKVAQVGLPPIPRTAA